MAYGWFFRAKIAGETHREPTQGEFFATDAISDPGTALVREGIQNALDAGIRGQKVTVRIYLSGKAKAVRADAIAPFVEKVWPHLTAKENGLRQEDVPSSREPCDYLLFEDFGTSGLTGDPAEPFRSKIGEKNHFYHFYRAEGQTDKEPNELGSWGIGKHVFPRSSRASTFFGVTVRVTDRRRMLMGRTILKSHWIDSKYCQDGYYGQLPTGTDQLVLPAADEGLLEQFCNLFSLDRRLDPGLSVIVPWPDAEITEQSVIRSVVQHYFVPILQEHLEVIVETPSIQTVLDSQSLVGEIEKIGGSLAAELQPLLALAQWAHQQSPEQIPKIVGPDPESGWTWSPKLFPTDVVTAAREAYRDGKPFALRIPVTLRKKGAEPQSSYFDVFLVRDTSGHSGRPTFIREGVIVSRVEAPRTRNVRAILLARDIPIAAFLRDSENPSHTEWQHDGSNFRGKYRSGRTDLNFVKRSVHEIMQVLTESDQEEDPTLLLDIFSLPSYEDEGGLPGNVEGRRNKIERKPGPTVELPRRPARFVVQKVAGGFSVAPTETGLASGTYLDIRIAYDVRRGNPLKRYETDDFRVDEEPIVLSPDPHGLDIVERQENRILAKITDRNFRIYVKGFDERRDLYVRVTPREQDANPAT